MTHVHVTRRHTERGSALLIVFLLAAVLAISLYMEMPTVAFEAKRVKEQLLIDRGNEYAHAVKLYYRRFRAYPPNIDALENTNRIRFLRHKFKDPITGDDKWRLLHAGPGGQLTDSKVHPIGLTQNGQTSGSSSGSAGSGATNSGFLINNSSATNSSGDTTTTPGTPAGLPQRPPEMPINGGAMTNPAANADPTQSLLPASGVQPIASQPGAAPFAPGAAMAGAGNLPLQPSPQIAQAANAGNAANPMEGVQGLMSNPNPLPATSTPATAAPLTNASASGVGVGGTVPAPTTAMSGMGVIQGGGTGLAGVASLAKGTSIKTVNDQTDYSLWEFYYDPTKDVALTGNSGMNTGAQPAGLAPNVLAPASAPSNSIPAPSATTPTPGATTPPPQPTS